MEAIGTNVLEEQTESAFLQAYQNTCISKHQKAHSYIAKFLWKEDRPDPICLQTLTPAREEHVL